MFLNSLSRSLFLSTSLKRSYSYLPRIYANTLLRLPVRCVHARGYNEYNDMWSHMFHQVNFALSGSRNTDNFVFVFKKYDKYLTDVQIAYAFQYITKNQLEKTPEFWSLIVPRVKSQLATLDRNCTKSLQHFIEGASSMQLQDNEFWELVEQKLYDQSLHRYFTLEELARIVVSLANVGRGSDALIETIEKTFVKHRKALTPEIIADVRQGFQKINKGSEILFRVLDDPSVDLPRLEA